MATGTMGVAAIALLATQAAADDVCVVYNQPYYHTGAECRDIQFDGLGDPDLDNDFAVDWNGTFWNYQLDENYAICPLDHSGLYSPLDPIGYVYLYVIDDNDFRNALCQLRSVDPHYLTFEASLPRYTTGKSAVAQRLDWTWSDLEDVGANNHWFIFCQIPGYQRGAPDERSGISGYVYSEEHCL